MPNYFNSMYFKRCRFFAGFQISVHTFYLANSNNMRNVGAKSSVILASMSGGQTVQRNDHSDACVRRSHIPTATPFICKRLIQRFRVVHGKNEQQSSRGWMPATSRIQKRSRQHRLSKVQLHYFMTYIIFLFLTIVYGCLLYTSDAADE